MDQKKLYKFEYFSFSPQRKLNGMNIALSNFLIEGV